MTGQLQYMAILIVQHGRDRMVVGFTVLVDWLVGFMVLNATFNTISVISWQSVLSVEETQVPRENQRPTKVTDKLYHIIFG
jgi:hypothetical protein